MWEASCQGPCRRSGGALRRVLKAHAANIMVLASPSLRFESAASGETSNEFRKMVCSSTMRRLWAALAPHLTNATGHHCSCQENLPVSPAGALDDDRSVVGSRVADPVAPTVASLLVTASLAARLDAAFVLTPSGLPAAKRLAELRCAAARREAGWAARSVAGAVACIELTRDDAAMSSRSLRLLRLSLCRQPECPLCGCRKFF